MNDVPEEAAAPPTRIRRTPAGEAWIRADVENELRRRVRVEREDRGRPEPAPDPPDPVVF